MRCKERELTTDDLFGPLDAAMLRVGVTVALIGLLLQALHFVLPWSSFEMNAALSSAGAILASLGAYGCHRSRREGEQEAPPSVVVSQGKVL